MVDLSGQSLTGKMVEIHLLNGNRFLGLVLEKDSDGLTMRCIPLKVLETAPEGGQITEQIRSIMGVKFFPYLNVEYVDIGGEPVGFDTLFAKWFRGRPLMDFFGESAIGPDHE
jgi:hypothetical protein